MAKNLDPVIDFRAWELPHLVGNTQVGEFIVTTFVSNITKLESHYLSQENKGTRVYSVVLYGQSKYYVEPETYDFIKCRMYKGTPIKIEEVVCVERV